MTGLPVFFRNFSTSSYMVSLVATAPPGEFTRSTTAFTAGSLAAFSICWVKRLRGFSVGWRNPGALGVDEHALDLNDRDLPGHDPLAGLDLDFFQFGAVGDGGHQKTRGSAADGRQEQGGEE